MSYLGFVVALTGFTYAIVIVFGALLGAPPQGWASLAVIVLVLGGLQMLMLGVLGEYLWRALDESRRRPRYIVEEATEAEETSRLALAAQQVEGAEIPSPQQPPGSQ